MTNFLRLACAFLLLAGCKTSSHSDLMTNNDARVKDNWYLTGEPKSLQALDSQGQKKYIHAVNTISTHYLNEYPDIVVKDLVAMSAPGVSLKPSIFPTLRKLARERRFDEIKRRTDGTLMLEAMLFKKFELHERYRWAEYNNSTGKQFDSHPSADELDRLLIVNSIIRAHRGEAYFQLINRKVDEHVWRKAYVAIDDILDEDEFERFGLPGSSLVTHPHPEIFAPVAAFVTDWLIENGLR